MPSQRTIRDVPITKVATITILSPPRYLSSVMLYMAPKVMTPIFMASLAVLTPACIHPGIPMVFTQIMPRMIPRRM